MTRTLLGKLLRDLRLALIVVALLLGAFQCLWYKITERIIGQLAPFFNTLASLGGLTSNDIRNVIFDGPGKIIRTIIGGEQIDLDSTMDMLSIGYVHPLMVTIFCIWAVGRAAGAVAGELDRGTLELLLAQPLARFRLILAHLCIDLLTIPLLCLSLWAGTCLGHLLVGPIEPRPPELKTALLRPKKPNPAQQERTRKRLEVRVADFGRGLWVVGGLIFAVSGYTMWLSAAGRFRWRVLGIAVLVTLLQFLVNVVGQMWDVLAPLRPLTIFYYYQPQKVILGQGWDVNFAVWNGGRPLIHVPMLLVLYGVGLAGYALALRTFQRRDLPAPL